MHTCADVFNCVVRSLLFTTDPLSYSSGHSKSEEIAKGHGRGGGRKGSAGVLTVLRLTALCTSCLLTIC